MDRRGVVKMLSIAVAGGAMGIASTGARADRAAQQLNVPLGLRFFDVRLFGATGDGVTLDTRAFNEAINACTSTGGGMVYVPPGIYLCGTIVMKSNVTLYLEATAIILGSARSEDFTLFPGPPVEGDANQRHLIFASGVENITIAGTGTIDGQGSKFWKHKPRPTTDEWGDVATFDYVPSKKRSSPLLEFYNCKTLRIYDVRIQNASGWTFRPIQCNNVFIDGVTINNPIYGVNTDGIDATCSKNVFISNCLIETADDCICLKSESPYGSDPVVSKNITITNCVLSCCCNGLKFGTATYGGYENIVFSNSVIYNEDVRMRERTISGIALEMVDGGYIDGVTVSNIRMQRVRSPIFIRRGARNPADNPAMNYLRGVMINNIHATGSIMTSSITGLPGSAVEDITLSHIRIDSEEAGTAEQAARRDVPEIPNGYPEARNFGHLPAYGLYARHVVGLRLHHVEFKVAATEERPALVCDDVVDLDIDSLRGAAVSEGPMIRLINTRGAFIRGCQAPNNTSVFLDVVGPETQRIAMLGNELTGARTALKTSDNVPASAVSQNGNLTNSG